MANVVHAYESRYRKAKDALEKALDMLGKEDMCGITALQSLNVTDELAQVFKEKPVILIQSMNIKLMVNRQIFLALRALDEIDMKLYREAMLIKLTDKGELANGKS